MSRHLVPGEDAWSGISAPHTTHHRTVRAQVQSVNEDNGFVTIGIGGMPSYGRYASVPWLWASFPTAGQAAWGRYMPFHDDTLKVSFDWDDTPHIVGYDVLAGGDGIADDKAGHPLLNKAVNSGQVLDFTRLESGEYDFMSVGGAYIRGYNTGQLLLSGGEVFVDIIRQQGLLRTQSTLHKQTTGGSTIRFGEVRRDGADGLETAAGPWNISGEAVEFDIDLGYHNGTARRKIARFAIGDLATDTSIDQRGGKERRAILDINDSSGTSSVFTFDVAADGSVSMTSSSTGDLSFDRDLTVSARKVTIKANDTVVPGKCHFGTITTGGALNGTELTNTMALPQSTVAASLATAISSFGAASGAPATHGEVAGVLSALLDYITALYNSISSATSTEVEIS